MCSTIFQEISFFAKVIWKHHSIEIFEHDKKKKTVPFTPRLNKSSEAPFQAISGDLLLGQTRAYFLGTILQELSGNQ